MDAQFRRAEKQVFWRTTYTKAAIDLGIIAGIIALAERNTTTSLEYSNHCSIGSEGSEGQHFLLSLLL